MDPRRHPARGERGTFLVEALCALALVGLLAAGAAAFIHAGMQLERRTARFDAGLAAARAVHARLAAVPFDGLAGFFAAPDDATRATLSTADGSAPADWAPLLAGLPQGALVARLEGLGEHGAPVPCRRATLLRLTVRARWNDGPREREVELWDVRF